MSIIYFLYMQKPKRTVQEDFLLSEKEYKFKRPMVILN